MFLSTSVSTNSMLQNLAKLTKANSSGDEALYLIDLSSKTSVMTVWHNAKVFNAFRTLLCSACPYSFNASKIVLSRKFTLVTPTADE